MNYRETYKHITLIAWSTITVILVMWSIATPVAEATILFKESIDYGTGDLPTSVAIGDLN